MCRKQLANHSPGAAIPGPYVRDTLSDINISVPNAFFALRILEKGEQNRKNEMIKGLSKKKIVLIMDSSMQRKCNHTLVYASHTFEKFYYYIVDDEISDKSTNSKEVINTIKRTPDRIKTSEKYPFDHKRYGKLQ